MSPSGERSNGMSSALTTLGSVSYILRNSCDAAMSSMRRLAVLFPTWAKSRSSRIFVIRCLGMVRAAASSDDRCQRGPQRAVHQGLDCFGAARLAMTKPRDRHCEPKAKQSRVRGKLIGPCKRSNSCIRSQILRRPEILVARSCLVRRIGHDLLKQQVHEQK